MIARVGPLVQFSEQKGKLQIEITLLDEYTKDMARDGVEKTVKGMGEKNAWFTQMLAIVPPSYWTNRYGRPHWNCSKPPGARSGNSSCTRAGSWPRDGTPTWIGSRSASRIVAGVESRNLDLPSFSPVCPPSCTIRSLRDTLVSDIRPGMIPPRSGMCDRPLGEELSHAVLEFIQGWLSLGPARTIPTAAGPSVRRSDATVVRR